MPCAARRAASPSAKRMAEGLCTWLSGLISCNPSRLKLWPGRTRSSPATPNVHRLCLHATPAEHAAGTSCGSIRGLARNRDFAGFRPKALPSLCPLQPTGWDAAGRVAAMEAGEQAEGRLPDSEGVSRSGCCSILAIRARRSSRRAVRAPVPPANRRWLLERYRRFSRLEMPGNPATLDELREGSHGHAIPSSSECWSRGQSACCRCSGASLSTRTLSYGWRCSLTSSCFVLYPSQPRCVKQNENKKRFSTTPARPIASRRTPSEAPVHCHRRNRRCLLPATSGGQSLVTC